MAKKVRFGQYTLELTSIDKILFPKDGVTKGDLIDYYRKIAETMLPYLQHRPLMMHRFPDGLKGEDFFQKEISDYFPDWIERVEVKKKDGKTTHVVCDNQATLVYLANQACITPHVWLSRIDNLEGPDQMIFDLDPPEKDFQLACAVANSLRELLEELGLATFVKTTGSQGFHVMAPLDRRADFDTVRSFARDVARYSVSADPEHVTTEQRKIKRGGRLFLDIFRNSYGQTAVAPYAVRAKDGAPIAAPIDWSELADCKLHPQQYTIHNIFKRLSQKSDPWEDVSRRAHSLKEPRRRLEALLAGKKS